MHVGLRSLAFTKRTPERSGSCRAASGRLQDEKVSLQTELSRAQQEGAEREARFRSLSAELASAENRCAKLKKEVVEVREFETARARQQVRHLK